MVGCGLVEPEEFKQPAQHSLTTEHVPLSGFADSLMAASDLDLHGEPFLSLGGGEGAAAATALENCTTTFQDLHLQAGALDVQGSALAPEGVEVEAMQALELAIEADKPKCVAAHSAIHSASRVGALTQRGAFRARRFEPSAEWQQMLQAVKEEATESGPLMLAGPGAEEDPALEPTEGVGHAEGAVQPQGEPGRTEPSTERGVDAGVDTVMR